MIQENSGITCDHPTLELKALTRHSLRSWLVNRYRSRNSIINYSWLVNPSDAPPKPVKATRRYSSFAVFDHTLVIHRSQAQPLDPTDPSGFGLRLCDLRLAGRLVRVLASLAAFDWLGSPSLPGLRHEMWRRRKQMEQFFITLLFSVPVFLMAMAFLAILDQEIL